MLISFALMTKAEAYEILLLPQSAEPDDVEDALDEQLFALRKEAMSKYMVPQLLDKLVRRADLLAECSEVVLGAPWTPLPLPELSPLTESSGIAFLQDFEKRESEMKHRLNAAKNAFQLKQALQLMQTHQRQYMEQFARVFSAYKKEMEQSTNSRSVLDTGKLILLMRKGENEAEMSSMIAQELSRVSMLK